MNSLVRPEARPPLERLVTALVDWRAAASQIVSHMERIARAGASKSSRSTVDVFSGLLVETIGPRLENGPEELEQAAVLIESIDEIVREEIDMVPLAPAARPSGPVRRRRGDREGEMLR